MFNLGLHNSTPRCLIKIIFFFLILIIFQKFLEGDDNTPKDIDLRTELLPGITTNSTASIANDVKKRSPGDVAVEGPISKKSKSEKIDMYVPH